MDTIILEEPSIPLPLEPAPLPEADDKRLWIGNIDNRLTEYHLLKIVQKFGAIKKFDFLFHKIGILKGQPRGYCFVTFENKEQAEKALKALNGKIVLGKELVVKWAHTIPAESCSTSKQIDPMLTKVATDDKETQNVLQQIMAIESKLKAMDEQRDKELEMCLSAIPLAANNPVLVNAKNKNLKQNPRNVPYKRHDRKPHSHHRR